MAFNYDSLTQGVNLSNSMDIVVNSYSVIDGNRIVNIRGLMPGGNQAAQTIDAYTKLQSDAILINKSDKATTYTKTEVDSRISDMRVDAYTTGQVDTFLTNKADKASTYTKTDIDGKVSVITASNTDIIQILGTKASSSNVYTKAEIDEHDVIFATSLNKKAEKVNSY